MDSALESILQQAAALARRYGAQRLVLFGSRARGDHHVRSAGRTLPLGHCSWPTQSDKQR